MVASKKASKQIVFVKKRDGRVVDFDIKKIANAVRKAFESTREVGEDQLEETVWQVTGFVMGKLKGEVVEIEVIQDTVENVLMTMGFYATAKAYILYRAKRAELRNINKTSMRVLRLLMIMSTFVIGVSMKIVI
jgi:ribonucleoside-triphosphate reductase